MVKAILAGTMFLSIPIIAQAQEQSRFGLSPQPLNAMQFAQQAQPTTQPQTPPSPQIAKTETSVFENWTLTCVEFAPPDKKRSCTAKTQVNQQGTNNIVFVWEVGLSTDRKMLSVIQVPTGVMIEPGVEMHIGNLPAQRVGYTSCDQNRCVASVPFDNKQAKEIAAVPKLEISIKAMNGSQINFQIGTAGFEKAYAQIAK